MRAVGANSASTLLVAALAGCFAMAPWTTRGQAVDFESRRLQGDAISESSGLVASRTHDGVFWTHNDSGDAPRIFAIDHSGALLAEVMVEGARNQDWEDIAIDDAGHLFLADIGNNGSQRLDLTVYKVPEPDPRSGVRSVQVQSALRYRYANQVIGTSAQNFDAESLIWHGGALYVFTKRRTDTQSEVYRLEDRAVGEPQVLQSLGTIELGVDGMNPGLARATAADVSSDGRCVALLTYGAIHLFESTGAALWPLIPIRHMTLEPSETQQAESLAWDGASLWFGNEQQQLFHVPDRMVRDSRCGEGLRSPL